MKCTNCNDTGRNPSSDLFDCTARGCAAATERRDLCTFVVEYLTAPDRRAPDDVYFAVHERARKVEREAGAARITQLESDLAWQREVTDAARANQADLLARAEKAEAELAELRKRVVPAEGDLLEVARALCSIAARRGELTPERRKHYPHADEEGSPVLAAAREACVARGYTEDGLAVDGVTYPAPAQPVPAPAQQTLEQLADEAFQKFGKPRMLGEAAPVGTELTDERAGLAAAFNREKFSRSVSREDFEAGWRAAGSAVAAPAVQEGQWISVDERLPAVEELVMVYAPPTPHDHPGSFNVSFDCIDPNDDDHASWLGHNEHYEHWCCVAKMEGCTGPSEKAPYTHWMPLPAAPTTTKGKSNG